MKTLLRSTFLSAPTDSAESFLENFNALDASGLDFDVPEDQAVWQFVRTFVQKHHHVPDVTTLTGHFGRTNEMSTVDRLQALRAMPPRSRGDFLIHLDHKAEDRRKLLVGKLLKEASEIVSQGLTIETGKKGEKKLLQGPMDAIRHIMDGAHAIVTPTSGTRLSGDVVHDGDDFLRMYDMMKADPLVGVGQFTGIRQIDDATNGAMKQQLWTHAAFTGGFKSSFMMNWAYNQAVYYKHNVLIFSLEMPYVQCRNMFYAMHSSHEKFAGIHPPLEYQLLKTGRLDPKAEWFLREHVVPDFNRADDYGSIQIEVSDPEKVDFTVQDMRARAETLYSKIPFNLLFVDHAGLVSPRRWVPSTTERLNEVMKDLKGVSRNFNKGQGMAVVALFQISREGYKSARKARGLDHSHSNVQPKKGDSKPKTVSNYVFDLSHLSYSNECLVGETLVRAKRGILPIQDVVVGDEVWSQTGWKDVLNTFDQGVQPTWKLVSDRGAELETTANHRVRTFKDGDICWTNVSDLQVGDKILSSIGGDFANISNPSLPPLTFQAYEKPRGEQGVPLRVPESLTESLAYLLGVWAGDGVCHKKAVCFTGNRKEVVLRERIRTEFESCFGHPIGMRESKSRPGSFDLQKWSQPLQRWFASVGGERGVSVPPTLRLATKSCIAAFLKGLFDSDGWVNNQNTIGLRMKNQGFLREIQFFLSLLGIDSTLHYCKSSLKITGKEYDSWILRLRGLASVQIFQALIGFTEPHKALRVSSFLGKKHRDTCVYPYGAWFRKIYQDHKKTLAADKKLHKYMENVCLKSLSNDLIPRSALTRMITHITDKESSEHVTVKQLQYVLSAQIHAVVSVQPTGESKPVYDIEVSGDHEYASGMFYSHNCERSSDVVTSTWLDEELAKDGKILFQCLKMRDGRPFDPCHASIFWPCRRIRTLDDPGVSEVLAATDVIDLSDV